MLNLQGRCFRCLSHVRLARVGALCGGSRARDDGAVAGVATGPGTGALGLGLAAGAVRTLHVLRYEDRVERWLDP